MAGRHLALRRLPGRLSGTAKPSHHSKAKAQDILTIPGLAAVEASLDRSRLLLQSGTDGAAMALDAASSTQSQ
jgi:hypothetical protein